MSCKIGKRSRGGYSAVFSRGRVELFGRYGSLGEHLGVVVAPSAMVVSESFVVSGRYEGRQEEAFVVVRPLRGVVIVTGS